MIALRLGGGGGGLTKRIAREKEGKKRKIPKPENYELQERKKKKKENSKAGKLRKKEFQCIACI